MWIYKMQRKPSGMWKKQNFQTFGKDCRKYPSKLRAGLGQKLLPV